MPFLVARRASDQSGITPEPIAVIRAEPTQSDKPPGQVWSSKDGRISVWVREWAEVINTARARLDFVNRHLAYETTRENALDYLHKTHTKFIPYIDNEEANSDADKEHTADAAI